MYFSKHNVKSIVSLFKRIPAGSDSDSVNSDVNSDDGTNNVNKVNNKHSDNEEESNNDRQSQENWIGPSCMPPLEVFEIAFHHPENLGGNATTLLPTSVVKEFPMVAL